MPAEELPAPTGYTPRWTPLRVTFIDANETVLVHPRDGDVIRTEQDTATSIQRLFEAGFFGTYVRIAWHCLRRMKDPRADVDFDAFLDLVDVQIGAGDVEPGEAGKATDPAPPTG